MAVGSTPEGTNWRGSSPAYTPSAPPSNVPAWRAAQSPTKYRSRWWKLGGVAAALGACLVAVSYAALWLNPAESARLLVLEAGYDTNLTVPDNAAGVGAGRDLIQFVNSAQASRGQLRAGEPSRFTRGGTLLPELDTFKEQTAIVFVAAHGGRDTDGAFLFPDDTTPDPAHRVRVKAVIDRLAKLPAKTHKLLILDATQSPHFMDLGVLHNDFADALEQLDADIAAVPNLVVLSSTGTDQRSWVSPEWGRTCFTHFLLEGLNGSGDLDRNQRLTAWELFEYVRPKVHDWARDHRAALQAPVLLPKGEGEARARGLTLASVAKVESKPPVAPTRFEPPAELTQQWDEYITLASANPAPIAYAPHLWREYEAWVLRYEGLLLNGNPEAAETARSKAADAKRRMEALRKLPVSPQTLHLPFALGGLSRPVVFPPAIDDGISRIASAPPADRGKLWTTLRDSLPGVEPDAARLLWCEGLVKWVATDPATRLAQAPALIALVTEGLTVRPSEIHLLAMFAEHAPRFAKSDALGPLLASLLELRVYAEGTVARQDSGWQKHGNLTTSLHELAWAQSGILRGDMLRRRAEDLAFASRPEPWQQAAEAGERAAEAYEATREASAGAAVILSHRLAATLPEIAPCLSHLPYADQAGRRLTWDTRRSRLLAAWEQAHALAAILTKGPDADTRKNAETLASIAALARVPLFALDVQLSMEYERLLASRPEFDAKQETRKELVEWWHEANAILAAPLDGRTPTAKRVELVNQLRQVSRQLLVTGTTNPQALREVTAGEMMEHAFQIARGLGLVQLARVGVKSVPNGAQVEFHLNNFALQSDGRKTLALIGQEIGQALNANPSPGENPTLAQLRTADWRVRIMPAAATVPLGPGPCDALRRALAAQVLLAQAERTYVDHWYGGARPYYRVAVEALLKDARTILGKPLEPATESLWAKRLEKEAPFPLMPAIGQKLWLTDEPNLRVTYPLSRSSDDPAGPGFAVFWQEPPFGNGEPGAREVRETGLPMSALPPEPVTAMLTPPAGGRPTAPTTVVGKGGLQAFFRGRFADTGSTVNYYPVADRTSVVVPTPAGATLAVRADPALNAKYGVATGSVSFVVDCSGSMRPPKDAALGDNGRYPIAIDALETILRGLPAGTTVSVWTFGARTPEATSADDTIREQLPPTRWKADNTDTINSLLATLRGLEPWEESSVMRGLLRARQALREAPGPYKAIVLLSDAVDNRFAQDPVYNPRKESIKDALKTRFADSGVRIGIVAIPVTDKDEVAAQSQFQTVETLQPAGKFVPPPQAESLLAWLRTGLNPRIRFAVSPVNTVSPSAPSFDLNAGDESADTWYPGRMPEGTYLLKLTTNRPYQFPLAVRRGDRLLLKLSEDRGSLKAERVWYAAEAPAVARTDSRRTGGMLALLQNQALDGKGLRMLTALEDMPAQDTILLGAEHPGDTWFELTPTTPKADPFALRFSTAPGYPAPCWSLDVAGWPTLPDGKTAAAHTLEAWWVPGTVAPATLRWEAPVGANPLDLPATRLPVMDNVVSLDSLRLEDHTVTTSPGQTATKTCLVVRFSHAPGKPVWARLTGLAPAGSEVRVYRGADKVTCLFWFAGEPPTAESIQANLKGLEIVSIADFQRECAAAGHYLKLTDSPPPSPASARPQPPADVR